MVLLKIELKILDAPFLLAELVAVCALRFPFQYHIGSFFVYPYMSDMFQVFQAEDLIFAQVDVASEPDLVFLYDFSFKEFVGTVVDMVSVRIVFPEKEVHNGLVSCLVMDFFHSGMHLRMNSYFAVRVDLA